MASKQHMARLASGWFRQMNEFDITCNTCTKNVDCEALWDVNEPRECHSSIEEWEESALADVD